MNHEFRLADIGEGLEEAEIIEWRVAVGDVVKRDQPLIEVMTDKSNAELPAPIAGKILALGGAVGDMISVGQVVAIIEPEPTAAPATTQRPTPQSPTAHSPTPQSAASTFQAAAGPPASKPSPDQTPTGAFHSATEVGARPKASPATRSEAQRRGLDLRAVVGTGPGGRILMSDLDARRTTAAASDGAAGPTTISLAPTSARPSPATSGQSPPTPALKPQPAPPEPVTTQVAKPEPPAATPFASRADVAGPSTAPGTDTDSTEVLPADASGGASIPLRGIRRRIAVNMTQSWTTIPHIHVFEQIDAEPLIEMRQGLKATGQTEFERLTPLTFFVAAVASALRAYPAANASLDMDAQTITQHGDINVGIAVASPDGLVVPVLQKADTLAFPALAKSVGSLTDQARSGALRAGAFSGGTTTITNFGSLGGEQATPLIRPPESLIFGFGSMAQRPMVDDGQVVARTTMHLVIGADHRLLDGDVVTAIMAHVSQRLTQPLTLLLHD